MIDTYKIKVVDGEERLFIYLNFDYEFASFNFNKSSKSLTKIIKEYIKKHNIAYKGTLVSLIVGGMFLGTVNLKEIDNYDNNHYVINLNEIVDVSGINIEKENNNIDEDKNIDNVIKNEEIKVERKETNKSNNSTNIKNVDINENKTNNNISKVEAKESNIDNKIYVKVKRSCWK